MNRKKITKAALSGLVAVTMVPAMAAPLVANAESESKSSIINVVFTDENGNNVGGGDQWVDADGDGVFKATELDLPEGYELNGGGDYFVDEDGDGIFKASELELPVGYKLNGGGDYFVTDPDINIPVTKINKGTIINVVFEDPQGNKLGGGDYVVDVDGDGIANYSELDLPVGIKCNW